MANKELPIIQKMYDAILWYVPLLNKLPRSHRFTIGDRILHGLYETLEQLTLARFESNKLARLEAINGRLNVLRLQTRLLLDLQLFAPERYAHAIKLLHEVGRDLGGWIKQQKVSTLSGSDGVGP